MSETDMIVWLRQQLDTDEAHAWKDIWAAERATAGRWVARYGVNLPASWVETESGPVAKLDGGRHEADALLVARFRPDNVRERAELVLRQVEAHRAILDVVSGWRHTTCEDSWYSCAQATEANGYDVDLACANDLRAGEPCDCGLEVRQRKILGPLTSIYSDRDGYRQEWSA